MAQALFAAGCFWGIQVSFDKQPGVISTKVGYSGGDAANPTYREVCSGKTGHAEVVQVEFDPTQIDYPALLEVFWNAHDPTQRNRQGFDVGTQYRSAIFCYDSGQMTEAKQSRDAAAKRLRRPIATEITPASHFWLAEEYHQNYIAKKHA